MRIEEKLTVGMFQRIRSLPATEDPIERLKQSELVASEIEGVPISEIKKWLHADLKRYMYEYTTINLRDYENKRIFHLKVNGTNFKLKDDPSKMSSGQFIDITQLMKNTDDPIQYMDKVLAIIAVKGKGYDAEGVEERAKLIQDALVKDVWGVFVFFLNLYWRYLKITETYLEQEMAKTINSATEILKGSGRGS